MANRDPGIELLEQDIAERLAPVCGHMSPESFRSLVHDIALVKIKYGVQSLASDQLHSPVVDAVVVARVSVKEEETRNGAA